MTGVTAALVGGEGGGGSGGAPGSVTWSAIYGVDNASSNTQTLSGFTGALSISAAASAGPVTIGYVQNGVAMTYTGAFTAHPGDTLAWSIGVGKFDKSGTLTISYGAAPTTLATIAYAVSSSWDGTGYR